MKYNVQIRFQWKKEMVTDWAEVQVADHIDSHDKFLDKLFRMQNRVLDDDVVIFDDFPSLTAGDMVSVHFDGETAKHYYCDSFGWREMSEEEQQRWIDCDDSFDRSPFKFKREGNKV